VNRKRGLKMKRLFTVFVVILLVAGIVVGCGGGEKDDVVTDDPVIENTSTSAFPNIVDEDNYSIEYPNDWKVSEESDKVTLKPMDDEIFTTEISISKMDMPGLSSGDVDELIEATKKEMGDEDFGFEFEKIKFNGYNAMKMSMSIMGISVETYNIPMNGIFIIVAANYGDDTKDIVFDILDTFRLK
jgi:hypothetical protein